MPTFAVGLITEPAQAEEIVASGQADVVALARAVLFDPRWPWHAAAALGATVEARSSTGDHSRVNSRTCLARPRWVGGEGGFCYVLDS